MGTVKRRDVSTEIEYDRPRFRWWLFLGGLLIFAGGFLVLMVLAQIIENLMGYMERPSSITLIQTSFGSTIAFGGILLLASGMWFWRRRFRRAVVAGLAGIFYIAAFIMASDWLVHGWGD